MGCLHQIPPLRAQGTLQKKRQKECKSQRGWQTPREQVSLNPHDLRSSELTNTDVACTGPAQVCIRWDPGTEMGQVDTCSQFLVQNLSPVDRHLQIKICFSLRESPWGNKLLFGVGYIYSSGWPSESEFTDIFGGFLSLSIASGLFFFLSLFVLFPIL